MFLPIIAALIPSLVGVAQKVIPTSDNDAQKEFVQNMLSKLYEKFLKGHIPDLPGIDEEAIFVQIFGTLIDYELNKVTK
jgi:hypothetical protein